MIKIETYLKIFNGKIQKVYKKQEFTDAICMLADGLYTYSIEKIYDNRSCRQNRYYWGVVVKAYRDGFLEIYNEPITLKESHEFFKNEFNYKEIINNESGEIKKQPLSTISLSTFNFFEYVENCRNFLLEWFGIETPDPPQRTEHEKTKHPTINLDEPIRMYEVVNKKAHNEQK